MIKLTGIKGLSKSVRDFCLNMVTQTIKNREATGEVRKDLMQYLIQLRNDRSNLEIGECGTGALGNNKHWEKTAEC